MPKHFRQNKTVSSSKKSSRSAESHTSARRSKKTESSSHDETSKKSEHGFISADDLAIRRNEHLLQEIEPTAEELSAENSDLKKGTAKSRKSKSDLPYNQDLLSNYMEQLSHIPLFTPEEEIQHAKDIETTELETWVLILQTPKAVSYLIEEYGHINADVRTKIEQLEQSYRKASARTYRKKLEDSPARTDTINDIAKTLRFEDFDKELLERVIARMRREVWGRRVLSENVAYRITHADMTNIEKSRGHGLRMRNHFVRANLRLVISVARKFQHYRIPFIDLIQEGNVGLMKAVHRFDHQRGFRFSTYAHWWIRQSIERAIINKGSQVRLPVHVIDSRRMVHRASATLQHSLGRIPTIDEISKHIKIPREKVDQILSGVQQDPISLDDYIGNSDPKRFLDLVRDDSGPSIDESLIRENTHSRVRELLHMLNPIEKDIIRRRFGLGTDTDETLDEIGKIYNLSRERVRQIQAQGLAKMRRMCERRRIF